MSITPHDTEKARLQRQVADLLAFVRETRDAAGQAYIVAFRVEIMAGEAADPSIRDSITDIHDNAVSVLAACGEVSLPLGGRP